MKEHKGRKMKGERRKMKGNEGREMKEGRKEGRKE